MMLETVEELGKPQFVNSDVMQATGRSAATIQTWVNRGILVPTSGQNPGYGQRRQYSAIDVCKIAVLGELTDFGFPPGEARRVAEYVGRKLSEGSDMSGNTMLWIYRRRVPGVIISAGFPREFDGDSPYGYQVVQGTFPMSTAEPTSLIVPIGMIITMTLRALRLILGDGEILSECEVETADGQKHKVMMPAVRIEGHLGHEEEPK